MNMLATEAPAGNGYTLEEAAPLIGMTAAQLRLYLWRHPELAPARYDRVGRLRFRKRVLSVDDVQRIIAERAK
jgi:hypothetical protein